MKRRLAAGLLAVALAACTETIADPWCDHAVTTTSSGAAFATRQCDSGEGGLYAVAGGAVTLLAREGQGWAPGDLFVADGRIAVTVDADGGDYVEIRGLDGALIAQSDPQDVQLFDPYFTTAGGVMTAYGAGVVTFDSALAIDGRGVRELRQDVRSIDLVGDDLVVGSFRGKYVFLFDATVPSELDKISDLIRGATEVALAPDGQTIAVVNPDDQVVEIHDRLFERRATLTTGADPRRIAFSADGARLAVVEGGDPSPDAEVRGAVRVYDLATSAELARVEMSGRPTSVAFGVGGDTVWVGRLFQGATELDIPSQAGVVSVGVAGGALTEVVLE
jgi:hypothetical protein